MTIHKVFMITYQKNISKNMGNDLQNLKLQLIAQISACNDAALLAYMLDFLQKEAEIAELSEEQKSEMDRRLIDLESSNETLEDAEEFLLKQKKQKGILKT